MLATAKLVLSLIDLTSLNDNDTEQSIDELCKKAQTSYGSVPAICIYSRFVPYAHKLLQNSAIKVATVTNFPHGSPDLELALYETQLAISRGSDEVDIVFPYHELMHGGHELGAKMVSSAKKICGNKTLKVILESGELQSEHLIHLASRICIENGADFIKTSTGKVAQNATLEAAKIMLNTIKDNGSKCGFKASGGIRTVAEAAKYIELAQQIMGKDWINASTFRFGASGLLADVLDMLNGEDSNSNNSATY